MKAALKRHYERVSQEPCLACGRHGVECHHLEALASTRVPGQMMPASHVTIAAFAVIPLCKSDHQGPRGIHSQAEADWLEANITGGRLYAIAWVARSVVETLAGGKP